VISLNLKRRHLNESQRAMVAARLANMPVSNPNPVGREDASGRFTSSPNSARLVTSAAKVQQHGSDGLIKAVDIGAITVSVADPLSEMDEETLAPEFMGDAAIAVTAMVEGDALDQIAQVGVVALQSLGREMTVVAGAREPAQGAQTPDVGGFFGKALRLGAHLLDDRVEVGAPSSRFVASESRKASRKKCRSACWRPMIRPSSAIRALALARSSPLPGRHAPDRP
jgi:hypothetical protein